LIYFNYICTKLFSYGKAW